ncbi:glutamate--cysteine ligase [Thiorhodococcus minor]|uniref:Glutamate--cysteine ligase n=1 Tax=Thiorhodococcus minor TaxID=57489 RepID=A0A6M0K3K0_9GAMM|nr:glutamate--cysteine ligase [Thiorhodococcus minor]NEV62905.1 glutamate--cysteine ligase [Thiorhodococcus minor]
MTFFAETLERRVVRLEDAGAARALQDNRIGLEKEGLRVSCGGRIAESPHPAALGSALTHPYITTDFSEALLELITPALTEPEAVLGFLHDVHTYVYRHLGDELLWATSMPCVLEGGARIPLAYYGTSNAATMKTVYRRGLGNRYGRTMQVIAGVHFNFSFADTFWSLYQDVRSSGDDRGGFRSESQMGMIRNLQRLGWLIPYLFGASPAVCASFVQGQETDLERFDETTLYYPHATSLRMGDIGYQNKQEEGTGMKACYDSLDAYVRSLTWAIETPCPQYETIGVKIGDRYEQLSANVLQIENEYYSTVRPKQITEWMEKPSLALRRRGVGYVELRSLDVNLFEPVGVGREQLDFLETLMLYCLLQESPRIGSRERRDIDENEVLTAHRGREPGLKLARNRSAVTLKQWAEEVIEDMQAVAALLDGASDGSHRQSLRRQSAKVADSELTPSAMMLSEMRERREGFFAMARRRSCEHQEYFKQQGLDEGGAQALDQWARVSIDRQREIEAADDQTFDDFLRAYAAQSERPVSPQA